MNEQSPAAVTGATALREVLDGRNMSLRALGRGADVDHASISRFLGGKVDFLQLDTWQKIAGFLALPLGTFIDVGTATAGTGLHAIKVRNLVASKLNPRKHADPDHLSDISDLADSIAAQGVLQPPTVRLLKNVQPAEGPAFDLWEVVIGNRRRQAFNSLIDRDIWAADATVDCRITDADDNTVLTMALIENVQRESMHWLDEGDALAKLFADGATVALLAQQIGKTPRWVQERIRVSTHLEAHGRTAADDDLLNFQQAKQLSRAPADLQATAMTSLADFDDDEPDDDQDDGFTPIYTEPVPFDAPAAAGKPDKPARAPFTNHEISLAITDPTIPVSRAIFPLEDYKGELVEADEDADPTPRGYGDAPGGARFVDVKQFRRLQNKEIKSLAGLYAKRVGHDGATGIAFFEHRTDRYFTPGGHWGDGQRWTTEEDEGTGKPGVIMVVDDGDLSVKIFDPAWKRGSKRSSTAPAGAAAQPAYDPIANTQLSARCVYARKAKSRILQDFVGNSGLWLMAMRLACYAMLRPDDGWTMLKLSEPHSVGGTIAPSIAGKLQSFADDAGVAYVRLDPEADLPKNVWQKPPPSELAIDVRTLAGKDKAWKAIFDMAQDDVTALFAALVASTVSDEFHGGDDLPELSDTPMTLDIVKRFGIDVAAKWRIDAGYLATLRKPDLAVLADRIGFVHHDADADDKGGNPWVGAVALPKKVTDQRASILDFVVRTDCRHVPPEMQFLDGKSMRKAITTLPKVKAPPAMSSPARSAPPKPAKGAANRAAENKRRIDAESRLRASADTPKPPKVARGGAK